MDNYYKILHIADFAEMEVVKAAYKAMTKLYHPDVNKTVDPSMMVNINLAYEVLGNPESKSKYDAELRQYQRADTSGRTSNTTTENHSKQPSKDTDYESGKPEVPVFKSKFANTVFSAARFVGQSFISSINQFQKDYENAYIHASELSNERLVKLYLNSVGAKRNGYAQALIDRGLLYRENGKLVPSYTFKQIVRR